MNIIEKLGISEWPWDTNLDDFHDLCIYDSDGEWLANLADKTEDAQIISAAPEMLEALIRSTKKMIAALPFLEDKDNRKMHGAIGMNMIAIEKATGKTWEEIKAL